MPDSTKQKKDQKSDKLDKLDLLGDIVEDTQAGNNLTNQKYDESELSKIAKQASEAEPTQELAQYWQSRYYDILSKDKFILSQKTIDAVTSKEPIDHPITPFGDLVLAPLLDKNGDLDEVQLQIIIENSIRLLDSLLDIISFKEKAEDVVTQYRKIGVGISDFANYFEKRQASSEIHEIDYIGNLISSTCYKVSESLAQEKGACANWSKIDHHLRPKSFEHWINPKTGEIKTAFELAEDFDQESVLNTNFQIVARRNSHILLFPPDLEWQIWSDRDDTSPITEIVDKPVLLPEVNLSSFNNLNNQSKERPLSSNKQFINPETGEKKKEIETQSSANLELAKLTNSLPGLIASSQKLSKQSVHSELENLLESPFQIGELVTIIDSELPSYNQVWQVIKLKSEKENVSVVINCGTPENQTIEVLPKQIKSLSTAEIIEQLNHKNEESKPRDLDLKVIGIIFNSKLTHFLVKKDNNQKILIQETTKLSQADGESITKKLLKQYSQELGIAAKISQLQTNQISSQGIVLIKELLNTGGTQNELAYWEPVENLSEYFSPDLEPILQDLISRKNELSQETLQKIRVESETLAEELEKVNEELQKLDKNALESELKSQLETDLRKKLEAELQRNQKKPDLQKIENDFQARLKLDLSTQEIKLKKEFQNKLQHELELQKKSLEQKYQSQIHSLKEKLEKVESKPKAKPVTYQSPFTRFKSPQTTQKARPNRSINSLKILQKYQNK